MSIKTWIESAFGGSGRDDGPTKDDINRLEDLVSVSKETGAALVETVKYIKAEILELEAAQESGEKQTERSAKKLAKLKTRYENLSEAITANRKELETNTVELGKNQKAVEKSSKGYSEYSKELAESGTAQGAVSKVVKDASSRLTKHTTILVATAVATKAWSLHMKAAARGAKDLLNAGAALPLNQERLNEALAASEVRFQKVNALAAVMSLKYGIAGDQVNSTADIIQEKLRLLDKDFGKSAGMTGETITQLTRNALLFARVARTDVAKGIDTMERRFWDMGGSPKSKLRKVRTEMRAVTDAISEINKDGADIFPEDMANNVMDVAAASESYGQNLVALTAIMSKAYKKSGELGASYKQQIKVGAQMMKGLTNVDDGIAYMVGRRLLKRARTDMPGLTEGLDESKKKRIQHITENKKISDFEKAQALQEIMSSETQGMAETLRVSSRFTGGKVGASVFKDIFKFDKLEDAILAREIFQDKGAEGAAEFIKDVKARTDKAGKGGKKGELFDEKERNKLQQLVGREEGSLKAKMYDAAPAWMKPALEAIVETAASSEGIVKIGLGILAAHAALKFIIGARSPVPMPVVLVGGGSGGMGGMGGGKGKRGRGKLGRAMGAMGRVAGVAGAAMTGKALYDAATGDVGFVESMGGAGGLALTGGMMAPSLYSGGTALAGMAAKGGMAGLAGSAGLVGAAGAAGYGVGTLLDQYGARAFGSDKAISTHIAMAGYDKQILESQRTAASDEARKWGLTDLEYWQYVSTNGKGQKRGTSDPMMMAADKKMIAERDSGGVMRSPDEIYKVMLASGKGRMRAAKTLAGKHGFESADTYDAKKYKDDKAHYESLPESYQQSFMGQYMMRQLEKDGAKIEKRGGMTGGNAGGSLAQGMKAYNRPANGNEMVFQPTRVAPDGTLKMEIPGFYSLLEAWDKERGLANRAWKYMTGKR